MLTIALAVLLMLSAGAQEASTAARVDAVFKDYDSTTSPGCAVAVYKGDSILYKRAYGMANLDHDVPLTTSSVFHVASVSKQFTAAAIVLLAQDGKLSLDDDIRKHVPELPDFGQRITIRHLANHTSGIRDQWDLLGLAGWRYSRDLITDDDVLGMLARQKDLNFPPGQRHLYSNSGFTLLAIIVSRASGMSFREFTDERIFKPLGMTNTHFRNNFGEIVKNQAYGYAPADRSFRLSVTNFDTAGATSLLTTVEDMVKWSENFESGKIGGKAFLDSLLTRGVLSDGRRIDYALGITHGAYRGLPTIGHGGSDAGYRADFVRFPEQQLGVATLCNIATANPGLLSRRVAEVFLPADKLAAITEPVADTSPEVPVPQETLARFAGVYWNQDDAVARRVVFENGRLHAADGAQRVAMKPIGNSTFVVSQGGNTMRVVFESGATGTIQMRIGNGPAFTRNEPFTPAADQLAEYSGTYRSDEMDAVYRMSVKDGRLTLDRQKQRPAALDPLFKDTWRGPVGVLQFTRDSAGRVSGFLLEGGRVRHVKFWKDTSPPRSSSVAAR